LTEPCLLLQKIRYSIGDREVLRGVDFDLFPGEIHALAGERMSGKSTLARIISGDLRNQSGRIILQGKEIPVLNPRTSLRRKIGIIYQHLNVLPTLDLVENVFAGHMPHFLISRADRQRMEAECIKLLHEFGLEIDIRVPVSRLSESEQQIVELLRLFSLDLDILLLDEISTRRTPAQMVVIFQILEHLRSHGKAIVYITSNVDEIFRLADRVTVIKDGLRKGTERVGDLDRIRLLSMAYSFALNREEGVFPRSSLALDRFNEELIQTLPTGAILLDAAGSVVLTNSVAEGLAGEGRTRFRGQALADVLHLVGVSGTDKDEILQALEMRKDATWARVDYDRGKTLRLKLSPLWDGPSFQGTILFLDDISLDPQVKEFLSRADQVASIAELAAGVAHEINNPLAILQNYIVLSKLSTVEEDRTDLLEKMEGELQRIVEIVQSLLSFSRVNQSPQKRMNVVKVLEEVLMLLSHRLRAKRIVVVRRWPETPVIVPLVENKAKQLFLNLIVNACEAVLQDGEIVLDVLCDLPTGHAEIRVTDNGYGIAPEILSEVFKPFFTTKVSKTNTGLGLSICQHIVELHRGVITVESEPGNTTFTVRLPLE
jgi:two-component system sensor histidine kinase AtoS